MQIHPEIAVKIEKSNGSGKLMHREAVRVLCAPACEGYYRYHRTRQKERN